MIRKCTTQRESLSSDGVMPSRLPLPKGARDLIGQRFGRLVVLEYTKSAHDHAYFACQCDCGKTHEARGSKLVEGRIVSCGCWKAEPAIRQAARLQVSPKRRKEIAEMGGKSFAAAIQRQKTLGTKVPTPPQKTSTS